MSNNKTKTKVPPLAKPVKTPPVKQPKSPPPDAVLKAEISLLRKAQMMRTFFEEVDFPYLEEDIEVLYELQMVVNRKGDDRTSEALGRVVELLETLQDTGETCGLYSAD